jgi:hypothetical protein
MTIHISTAARNAAANAAVDLVDGGTGPGKIRIYSGTQPAGPDTAVGAQVLLAEATLSDPAFANVVNGVKVLDNTPIPAGTGLAAGTAAWFRIVDSDDVAVIDGSAGISSDSPARDLILNTSAITVGVDVEITSGTLTMPG